MKITERRLRTNLYNIFKNNNNNNFVLVLGLAETLNRYIGYNKQYYICIINCFGNFL